MLENAHTKDKIYCHTSVVTKDDLEVRSKGHWYYVSEPLNEEGYMIVSHNYGKGRLWKEDFDHFLFNEEPLQKKRLVYYAHFMGIYNTKQEERDMELLKALFPDADIINPNCEEIQEKCKQIKEAGGNAMDMFEDIVKGCSVVAFRGCVNGKIGAGVWKEIMTAKECGIPVVELPSYLDREMSVADTRLMLTELGCR